MKILVFGNEDMLEDSIPFRILSALREYFPEHTFLTQDPNEEWDMDEPFFVLDTVVGLDEPRVFDSLDDFEHAPRVSMHDFDALSNLCFLKKLGKLPDIKIVGIPPTISEQKALEKVTALLSQISASSPQA